MWNLVPMFVSPKRPLSWKGCESVLYLLQRQRKTGHVGFVMFFGFHIGDTWQSRTSFVDFAQVYIYRMLWFFVPRQNTCPWTNQTFVENVKEVELVKSGGMEEGSGFHMAWRSTCIVGRPA